MSRYGLEIRAASALDAAGLSALLASVGRPITASEVALRLETIAVAGNGIVLLAMEWGPPSGVIAVGWRPTLVDERHAATIDILAVAPDERRRGIARTLLKAASQAARTAGCGTIQLAMPVNEDGGLAAFASASGFDGAGVLTTRALRKRGGG